MKPVLKPKKIAVIIRSIILLILVGGFAYYLGLNKSDRDLFTWKPTQGLLSPSKNITDSTNCSFRKSFNVFFNADDPTQPTGQKIRYSYSNDNTADTISLIDLDTDHPKIRTNSGEFEPAIVDNNPSTITLVDINNIKSSLGHPITIYKLFKKNGILIYADANDGPIVGPFGSLEMGYCN